MLASSSVIILEPTKRTTTKDREDHPKVMIRQRQQRQLPPPQQQQQQLSIQPCQRCLVVILLALGIFTFVVNLALLELGDLPNNLFSPHGQQRQRQSSIQHQQQQHQEQQQRREENNEQGEEEQQQQRDDHDEKGEEEQQPNPRRRKKQQQLQQQQQKQQQQQQRYRRKRRVEKTDAPIRRRRRRQLPPPNVVEFLNKVGLLEWYMGENSTSSHESSNEGGSSEGSSNDIDAVDQQVEFLAQHWHVIEERLGPNAPVMIGLDTCAAYRAKIPFRKRIIAPAGIFNSGTNLLSKLLYDNCWISKTRGTLRADHAHIQWQVNWGKHTPAQFRSNYSIEEFFANDRFLPIVTTRDPYSWLQTMCRVRYSVHWFHHAAEHCPNLVPNEIDQKWYYKVLRREIPYSKHQEPWLYDNLNDLANYTPDLDHVPVRVRFKAGNLYFHNIMEVWNFWYHAYYNNVNYPRLMIRLEDLVIHPEAVITQVCECVGGRVTKPFRHAVDSAKPGDENVHGTVKTNRLDAMIKLIQENRTGGMTTDDQVFAKEHLSDDLLQAFQYPHPPMT